MKTMYYYSDEKESLVEVDVKSVVLKILLVSDSIETEIVSYKIINGENEYEMKGFEFYESIHDFRKMTPVDFHYIDYVEEAFGGCTGDLMRIVNKRGRPVNCSIEGEKYEIIFLEDGTTKSVPCSGKRYYTSIEEYNLNECYTELKKDGTKVEHKSLNNMLSLTEEERDEIEFVKEKIDSLSKRGIRLFYTIDDWKLRFVKGMMAYPKTKHSSYVESLDELLSSRFYKESVEVENLNHYYNEDDYLDVDVE